MGLKQIAQETVASLERGTYISAEGKEVDFMPLLKRCMEGTRGFSPDALVKIREEVLASPSPAIQTKFELVNETTLQGAARLAAQAASQEQIGVLNFASAKHPGGGFLGGARAQEESLARSSGLYYSLLRCPDYYGFNRRLKTSLYSDWMIYSPECPVIRNDQGDWLETPYTVTFLTSPAPNAEAILMNEPENLPKIPATFRERISKLLALADHQGCETLILGAWGCGAFRNDPEVVAQIFWEQLGPRGLFGGRFNKILFSVLDTAPSLRIYNAFARYFGATRKGK